MPACDVHTIGKRDDAAVTEDGTPSSVVAAAGKSVVQHTACTTGTFATQMHTRSTTVPPYSKTHEITRQRMEFQFRSPPRCPLLLAGDTAVGLHVTFNLVLRMVTATLLQPGGRKAKRIQQRKFSRYTCSQFCENLLRRRQ